MKYVALLRGINVGGNNLIKMSELQKAITESGFKNVTTYIQSGNIILESDESELVISKKLERELLKKFKITLRVVTLSKKSVEKVLEEVPPEWKKSNDLRCYISFVIPPLSPKEALVEIKPKEGVDFLKTGKFALYMSTLLSGLTKSGYTKLVGTKVYKLMTIRNYNTVKKILEKMN